MKFFYTNINKFMWKHSFIKSCIHFASRFCPYMVAIFYSLFLLKIFLNNSGNMLILTSEPIAVLIITIILRVIINRKRPSEKYDLIPIDGSRKKGRSFPSIHVALSVSIALAVLHYGPNMGLLLSTLAGTITIVRLLSGVHYITDIAAGIIIAVAVNMI
ncbi:phosphatase PAP2 family protein [uncultured Thomasclavelia sp.]|uniref:phosphatase PAP2 family protein n=1 Tax=uncultured Thomasclavelia sp. TaxID=3025759 RepID=UPI0026085704|nr:phosphatase PAP2 family protein [uncultured Thomasclavelia sp.]